MDALRMAQIAEAVSEHDEPPLIYRTTIRGGGIDECIGYATDCDPVKALEAFARFHGFTDYSIDQDGLRVILCPSTITHGGHYRWYVYA